jgi:hypothetical protein
MPSAIEPLAFLAAGPRSGSSCACTQYKREDRYRFAIDIHNGMGCEVRGMYSTDLDPVNSPTDLIFPNEWRSAPVRDCSTASQASES